MRWILVIVFFSFPAFSTPVISEKDQTIFPDHENSKIIYYMPVSGSLKMNEQGSPEFGLSWGETEGELTGTYEFTVSESQKEKLSDLKSKGFIIRSPDLQSTRIKAVYPKGVQVMAPPYIRPDSTFTFEATFKDPASFVKNYFQGYESNYTFVYCYRVSGLSPRLRMSTQLNEAKIKSYFQELIRNRIVPRERILYDVKELFGSVYSGDTDKGVYSDPSEIITDIFIKNYFIVVKEHEDPNEVRYVFNDKKAYSDNDIPFELFGRYPVAQERCIPLYDMALNGRKELFNYIPGLN